MQLCDFGWADLGTWESLHEASPKDMHQNVTINGHTLLYDCKDNMIAVPKNKLVVLHDLEGYLVGTETGTIEVTHQGRTGTTEFSTGEDGATCVTDLRLT